jgi:hypothetical protein
MQRRVGDGAGREFADAGGEGTLRAVGEKTVVQKGVPVAGKQMQVLMKAKRGLVEKGSSEATNAVCACLQHPQRYVRSAALEALPKVCVRGDRECLDMLLRLLEQSKTLGALEAATAALELMVVSGDLETVGRLSSIFRATPAAAVKCAVVSAMARVARQAAAVDALLRFFFIEKEKEAEAAAVHSGGARGDGGDAAGEAGVCVGERGEVGGVGHGVVAGGGCHDWGGGSRSVYSGGEEMSAESAAVKVRIIQTASDTVLSVCPRRPLFAYFTSYFTT